MGDGLAEPGGVQKIARFHSLNKKAPLQPHGDLHSLLISCQPRPCSVQHSPYMALDLSLKKKDGRDKAAVWQSWAGVAFRWLGKRAGPMRGL